MINITLVGGNVVVVEIGNYIVVDKTEWRICDRNTGKIIKTIPIENILGLYEQVK